MEFWSKRFDFAKAAHPMGDEYDSVSYTHLTLPTN